MGGGAMRGDDRWGGEGTKGRGEGRGGGGKGGEKRRGKERGREGRWGGGWGHMGGGEETRVAERAMGTTNMFIERRGTNLVHFSFLSFLFFFFPFLFLFLPSSCVFVFVDASIGLTLLTFIDTSSLVRKILCTLGETSTLPHFFFG